MTTLYRCDQCHKLIDPVEGDVRTVLEMRLRSDGDIEDEYLDLCESCKPKSLGAYIDWVLMEMEE